MEFTFTFIRLFFWSIYLAAPLMLFLCLVIVVLGLVVARLEKWQRFDALYWSFITATTVGYGDIRPVRRVSRILSILIALTGILFTGILVAMALHTATMSFEKHVSAEAVKEIRQRF
jgi:voltage-gated potassium channel